MTEVQVPIRFEEKTEFEVEDYDVKIENLEITEFRKILKKNYSKNIEVSKWLMTQKDLSPEYISRHILK